MTKQKFLVTGGAGFIGSHLCEALVARGCAVRVLDDFSSGHRENLRAVRDEIETIEGDVRDVAAVESAARGVDGVFHLAALVSVPDSVNRPRDSHAINAGGTLNVLLAARAAGARRVVYASTAAAYGSDPELPKREDMLPMPESPYAADKVAGELYLRVFAKLYGMGTVALRFFNVYGPRQDPRSPYSGVISRFVHALRTGARPVVFGDGAQTRDFVYVADVARACVAAMFNPAVGRGAVLNVATGRSVSLLELLRELGELTGRAIEPEFAPERPGDIRHSAADVRRAADTLGFRAEVSLRDGLRRLLIYEGLLPAGGQ